MIIVPVVAIPTAPAIVNFALSIDVPFFKSSPSFATYRTFGAELIPDAPVLMVTLSPIVIDEPVIVISPAVIVLLLPSITTDALPTLRIPTTRASPSTYNAVFPMPIVTVPIPLEEPRVVIPDTDKFLPTLTSVLAVTIPKESTLVTSS